MTTLIPMEFSFSFTVVVSSAKAMNFDNSPHPRPNEQEQPRDMDGFHSCGRFLSSCNSVVVGESRFLQEYDLGKIRTLSDILNYVQFPISPRDCAGSGTEIVLLHSFPRECSQ